MTTTTSATPASPSSSPRLPSPPPLTEVQLPPTSPGLGDGASTSQLGLEAQGTNNEESTRRIRPGSKAEDMASGPPLVPLSDLDSAFQLQEHLKSLYYAHTQPAHLSHTRPIDREAARALAEPPAGVDRSLWLYELCRLLTNKLNTIIIAFFAEDPPCSAGTCPEMRASEWQYLCAVHDPPKPCCAIDYCCHTLDWAANMLTSTKHFPSRLTLGGGGGDHGAGGNGGVAMAQTQGLRNLTNICRRLYRIFAHAWYQHRAVFWQVESQTGLYIFFKTVCDIYHLIPEDSYTVPDEAEGADVRIEGGRDRFDNHHARSQQGAQPATIILKKQADDHHASQETEPRRGSEQVETGASSIASPATPGAIPSEFTSHPRGHARSLSSASSIMTAVATVPEVDEEAEEEAVRKRDDKEQEAEKEAGNESAAPSAPPMPFPPPTPVITEAPPDEPAKDAQSKETNAQNEDVAVENSSHESPEDSTADDSRAPAPTVEEKPSAEPEEPPPPSPPTTQPMGEERNPQAPDELAVQEDPRETEPSTSPSESKDVAATQDHHHPAEALQPTSTESDTPATASKPVLDLPSEKPENPVQPSDSAEERGAAAETKGEDDGGKVEEKGG